MYVYDYIYVCLWCICNVDIYACNSYCTVLCTIWPIPSEFHVFCQNFYYPENGSKMGQKQGFFELIEKFGNFYWICSVMQICFICCVPAQILYLENFCSWDIRQNILSQSDCRIFQSTISSV